MKSSAKKVGGSESAAVVYLQPLATIVAADGDDLDEEERVALHRELEASIAEADAGETEDFATVIAEMRHLR